MQPWPLSSRSSCRSTTRRAASRPASAACAPTWTASSPSRPSSPSPTTPAATPRSRSPGGWRASSLACACSTSTTRAEGGPSSAPGRRAARRSSPTWTSTSPPGSRPSCHSWPRCCRVTATSPSGRGCREAPTSSAGRNASSSPASTTGSSAPSCTVASATRSAASRPYAAPSCPFCCRSSRTTTGSSTPSCCSWRSATGCGSTKSPSTGWTTRIRASTSSPRPWVT